MIILSSLRVGTACAGINESIVEWFANDATFLGIRQMAVRPVIDTTGKTFDFNVADIVTQALRQRLEQADIYQVSPDSLPKQGIE